MDPTPHRKTQPEYWFPAKKKGWGWGPPTIWQGWLALLAFAALVLVGAVALLPSWGSLVFVAYAVLLCAALMLVCWVKGESPSRSKRRE